MTKRPTARERAQRERDAFLRFMDRAGLRG